MSDWTKQFNYLAIFLENAPLLQNGKFASYS